MTNVKSTKRALIMSALSVVLCLSMLIGSTFAWFTDSVTSANNIIKSGNLDIVLEYWNGSEWVDVADKSDILTNTLWEPGVTEVAYLRVENAGSLALKYQLGVNIVSETAGVNAAGASFILSDYLNFGVVENVNGETDAYATREEAVADIADEKLISEGFAKATSMMPADELYFALVVYMPENTGNDANHNGVNVPAINLGINVVATQMTSEEDSFDKYYDGAAAWYGDVDTTWYNTTDTEFVLYTSEQFAGFAQLVNTCVDSFAGKTVKLGSNLNLNNVEWTPIGDVEADDFVGFKGTFDGNGKTIYNLAIDSDTWGQGLFGYATANITVKNLNVVNVNITASDNAGAIAGLVDNATFENIHVSGDVSITGTASDGHIGGIVGRSYNGVFTNCSVVANDGSAITGAGSFAGGISGYQCNRSKAFTDCQVKNITITGYAAVGGICGVMNVGGTFTGCTVEDVVLNKTRVDGNPSIGAIVGTYSGPAATSDFTNNTIKNVSINGSAIEYADYNELYGSEYSGGAATDFDTTGTTVENLVNNLAPCVKNIDDLKAAVTTPNETVALAKGTYKFPTSVAEGVTIICEEGTVFEGNSKLNINGATVVGATFSNPNGTVVDQTINGTFKDCTFTGSNALRWCYAGETVVFENCVFSGDVYGVHFDGGANDVVFKNCTLSGFNAFAGAIKNLTFEGCTFVGNGKSAYNGANFWGNVTLTECTFVFDGSTQYEWLDLCSAATKAIVTDCVVTDGTNELDIADFFTKRKPDAQIIVDGVEINK